MATGDPRERCATPGRQTGGPSPPTSASSPCRRFPPWPSRPSASPSWPAPTCWRRAPPPCRPGHDPPPSCEAS